MLSSIPAQVRKLLVQDQDEQLGLRIIYKTSEIYLEESKKLKVKNTASCIINEIPTIRFLIG